MTFENIVGKGNVVTFFPFSILPSLNDEALNLCMKDRRGKCLKPTLSHELIF